MILHHEYDRACLSTLLIFFEISHSKEKCIFFVLQRETGRNRFYCCTRQQQLLLLLPLLPLLVLARVHSFPQRAAGLRPFLTLISTPPSAAAALLASAAAVRSIAAATSSLAPAAVAYLSVTAAARRCLLFLLGMKKMRSCFLSPTGQTNRIFVSLVPLLMHAAFFFFRCTLSLNIAALALLLWQQFC